MITLDRILHSRRARGLWLPLGERCGVLRRAERHLAGTLTILTYHRVLSDEQAAVYPFDSLAVPLSVFRQQIAWLKQRTVLPLGQAMRDLEGRHRAEPLFSITFDDGYLDNYELAAPVIEAAGLSATFFITAGIVEQGQTLWFDRAFSAATIAGLSDPMAWVRSLKSLSPETREQRIDELGSAVDDGLAGVMMSPEHVTQLAIRGHEIGSHTMSHPILTHLAPEELAAELVESRVRLQQWSGQRVEGFCYPNGDTSEQVIAACRDAGYTYACSTRPGRNRLPLDPFVLRRVQVDPRRVTRAGRHDHLAFHADLCLMEVL